MTGRSAITIKSCRGLRKIASRMRSKTNYLLFTRKRNCIVRPFNQYQDYNLLQRKLVFIDVKIALRMVVQGVRHDTSDTYLTLARLALSEPSCRLKNREHVFQLSLLNTTDSLLR